MSLHGKWVCDYCRGVLSKGPVEISPTQAGTTANATVAAAADAPVLIEQTSKGLKGQGCIASVLLLAGIWMAFGFFGPSLSAIGIILACSALLWLIGVKVTTWWEHG